MSVLRPGSALKSSKVSERRGRSLLLATILVFSIFIVYRGILCLPYVGDDWAILHKMAFRTPREILLLSIDTSLLQIRPLQYLYTWAFLALCGTYSSIFHIPAIIAHTCNALLLVYLMRLITRSTAIAWVIGALYAIAICIHLMPQMWLVGSSDIIGPFFFFASFTCLIRKQHTFSAIAFLMALLFKEFALALLPVMVLYLVVENWHKRGAVGAVSQAVKRLIAHVVIAVPFLVYKLMFLPSPMKFAPDHPYKMSLTGPHVIKNGVIYCLCLLQTVLPFEISTPRKLVRALLSGSVQDIAFLGLFLCGIVALCVAAISIRKRPRRVVEWNCKSLYTLLVVWSIMGMAPVYFLPNHVDAYYMTYSLPALLAIILLGVRSIAWKIGFRRKEMVGIAVGFLALQFVWSSTYVARMSDRGYFMLSGARQTIAVHGYLMKHFSTLPNHTVFIVGGDNSTLWALRNDKAMQLWYKDRSLKVYDARLIKAEGPRLYAYSPPKNIWFPGTKIEGKRVEIDRAAVVCLKITRGFHVLRCDVVDMLTRGASRCTLRTAPCHQQSYVIRNQVSSVHAN